MGRTFRGLSKKERQKMARASKEARNARKFRHEEEDIENDNFRKKNRNRKSSELDGDFFEDGYYDS